MAGNRARIERMRRWAREGRSMVAKATASSGLGEINIDVVKPQLQIPVRVKEEQKSRRSILMRIEVWQFQLARRHGGAALRRDLQISKMMVEVFPVLLRQSQHDHDADWAIRMSVDRQLVTLGADELARRAGDFQRKPEACPGIVQLHDIEA